jgi:hypothetical protein
LKRLAFYTAISALFINVLPAANAAILIKPMVQLAQVDPAATNVISSGAQLAVIGNREKNGFIQLINGPTVELTSGLESFVSAATVDASGNFLIVGASSNPIVGTLPPIQGVLNPDNVIPDPVSSNKSDAVNLIYWKVDTTGKILDTQTMPMTSATIPYAVISDAAGITIAGSLYSNPGSIGFVTNWNAKPILIGKSFTSIFGITRTSNSAIIAIGQSSDKLLNTTLKGKVDGFLAKINNDKLTSVQRSSDVNSQRSWRSINSSLVLGGNSNSSAVITKFNNNFAPLWTDRYLSTGTALTATSGKFTYGAFVSAGAIKSLPTWKRKNAVLLLSFDSKGQITGASYINSTILNGITANSTVGPVLLSGGFLYRA